MIVLLIKVHRHYYEATPLDLSSSFELSACRGILSITYFKIDNHCFSLIKSLDFCFKSIFDICWLSMNIKAEFTTWNWANFHQHLKRHRHKYSNQEVYFQIAAVSIHLTVISKAIFFQRWQVKIKWKVHLISLDYVYIVQDKISNFL